MQPLLNNRYQVIGTLGAGGFGETFLAEDTQMPSHRRCVIKQLRPIQNNPQIYQLVQERFQREAAILEDLGGYTDQIPTLYAYFQSSGEFYLVQEWIQGDTLTARIQQKGLCSETTVREILENLLPVLEYVHSTGIIHRDIKPDNIILRHRDGKPVLIDFGAVRETMGTMLNSQGNPTSSIVIGTPGYMPSEQAAGRPVYSSDLYSLGLTAIYLLTGKQPQELETDPQTGEIIWYRHALNISSILAGMINRAIAYHPRERFATAREMLSALQFAPGTVPQPIVINTPPSVIPQNSTIVSPSPSSQTDNQGNKRKGKLKGGLIAGGLIGAATILGVILDELPEPVDQPIIQPATNNSQEAMPVESQIPSNLAPISTPTPPATPLTSDFFGAISYSSVTGIYGLATSSSQAEAESTALIDCQRKSGANDCLGLLWFKNSWGALAVGSNGAYGTGWGAKIDHPPGGKELAEEYALQTCQQYGGVNCRVIVSTEARRN
ncbi:protein kinase domain-containing protein [Nostoc sp. CCY0012]|uniref:protein kinase domain-containing protein n=1 Tax=Nostoc sp. CCY0012 TaxID=1056123 RepID=UPI0039C5C01E